MTGTLFLKWLARLVEFAIRLLIFIVPVALVAHWCDLQPTWKLFAFVGFWSFWSSVVFSAKEESAKQEDRPAVIERKVEVMSPAQVAVEARKSTRALPVHYGRPRA
jgi:hypothetical protein